MSDPLNSRPAISGPQPNPWSQPTAAVGGGSRPERRVPLDLDRETKKAKQRPVGDVVVKALRCELIRRDMKIHELATLIGLSYERLRIYMADGFSSETVRYVVENKLGFLPFWSSARTVELRRQCADRLGFDPFLMKKDDLIYRADRLPIRRPNINSTWSQWANAYLDFIAANPDFSRSSRS